MQGKLTIKQALEIIESGTWAGPIRFITANEAKGSGGEVREVKKFRIARALRQAQRDKGGMDKAAPIVLYQGKDPNHRKNFTRNIELQNRSIMTIHPALITHLNGREVV